MTGVESAMNASCDGELAIDTERDIVEARRMARELAMQAGFGCTDVTRIVTVASEMARNIYRYAGCGVMRWRRLAEERRAGLELQFVDSGPGIADLELALQPGYSTAASLGLGLPATRRLMDEVDIDTAVGRGTRITLKKWRRT
jgi:serine/threonine-protein kinase RsbT